MLNPPAYKTLLKEDPVYYVQEVLAESKFKPDESQKEFLRATNEEIILCWSRQSGKTTSAAVKLTHRVMTTSGLQVLIISASQRQAGIMQSIVRQFVLMAQKTVKKWRIVKEFEMHEDPLDDNSKMIKCNAMALEIGNGSEVISVPAKEDTIVGYSPDIIAIDEAARVPDAVYYAILPMRAAHPCQLILISTPNGQRGFFYEEWHENRRPWLKRMVTAHDCPRISKEFLTQERNAVPRDIFEQEYECSYLAVAGSLFTPEQIASMFTTRPEEQAIADSMATDQLADTVAWRTAPIGQQLDALFSRYLDAMQGTQ